MFNPFDAVSVYMRSRNRPHFSIKKQQLTAVLESLFLDIICPSVVKAMIKV